MIPYAKQSISAQDIQAVDEVLQSDFLTQGPVVPLFEKAVAEYCKVKHAVAVNSGTSALHLACLALGLKPIDWLWTSPITFAASANCALYCGAQVDFVDIDLSTGLLNIAALEEKLIDAEHKGKLPKIVIPVHYAGQSCDMKAIHALSQRFGFKIIEDASHAIGAHYLDSMVGSCRYSDATVFSFHPVKIITTGEGGMIVTNHDEVASNTQLLRSHGITRDSAQMVNTNEGPWYYEQIALGFNYRLTDIQAALGLSQLQSIDFFLKRRQEIAAFYQRELSHLPLSLPTEVVGNSSAWHLFVIQLQLDVLDKSRLEVFTQLKEMGIGVNVHYIPVYRHPYYQKIGFSPSNFPNAEEFYQRIISLPMFPGLDDKMLEEVLRCLNKVLL